MESKYIGIKKKERGMYGNEGRIFTLECSGFYRCEQTGTDFSKEQMKHDLDLGYLKPYKDGK